MFEFSIISWIAFSLALLVFLINILSGKGLYSWFVFWKSALFIKFYKKKLLKKLPAFKQLHRTDFSAIDIGLIPSASEYKIERPCTEPFQHCDGIHFFGVDTYQNWIDICVNKIKNDLASIWIFLKLPNGDEYKLPGNSDTRKPYIDVEHGFYSSGLQIKCLSPLRKWRISFNGLLQKSCNDDQIGGLIHVRFSFIWLAMSVGQELDINFNPRNLAKAFSNAASEVGYKNMQSFRDMENRYEQWGQLMGTLKIKGNEDKELYLWSCRTRILDNPLWHEKVSFAKFYMYFKDGYPLKVECLNVEQFLSNYTHAYSTNGFGGIEQASDCDFDLNKLKSNTSKINFSYKISSEKRNITIEFTGENKEVLTGPNLELSVILRPFKVLIDNGDEGLGILHLGKSTENITEISIPSQHLLLKEIQPIYCNRLVISLSDDECKNSLVSGGKGCSLALLTSLAVKEPLFHVPDGFVITTIAFEKHIKDNSFINIAIQRLVDVSGGKIDGILKAECDKCIEEFLSIKISEDLKAEIQDVLLSQFESIENKRFSIRSSACGEDSEDLSTAGQMLTVLGVRGINNIVDAVIKCWSSKFGFEAVQYARQNGQPIRSPMAVVVQEMVPSEVSGVMFTVDPVTGDPSHPYITANYGLGESVVSALAEPDTIILRRNLNNSITVKEHIIGAKKTQIHMTMGEGTEEKFLSSESLSTCLNDEWAVKIGSIGILVESCFCAPRDIEWALHKDKLYLLQARPVTTLHTETDFELIHDQDTPLRSDNEFWTKANVGEVYLAATSPLGISVIVNAHDVLSHRGTVLREGISIDNYCPYFNHMLPLTHRHVTLSIIELLYTQNEKEINNMQKAFEVALFGRIIGTDEMHQAGVKKYGYASKGKRWYMMIFMLLFSFKIKGIIKVMEEKLKKHKIPLETFTTVDRTWKGLLEQFNFYNSLVEAHGVVTYMSCMYNLIVLTILAKGKDEWDSELYCDFATLLSACSGVESANVPESLQKLAQVIAKNFDTFSSLTVDMAHKVLTADKGDAGRLFKEFLERHGHRCIKEFDMYSISWGMNSASLIPTLQNLVASPVILNIEQKEEMSVEVVISKIKTPLSDFNKKMLRYFLPWSRQAVRQREHTKSMLIKLVDCFRQTCHQLGKLMAQEGMLPSSDLVFFLTLEEIKEIIDVRKPGLVPKALRRSRLHSKLEKLQFPEIIQGIPKPISEEENVSMYSKSFTLTGIPVCQGKVKAKARVVTCLSEASTIQNGDILITQSTDIGWTPYFPLLSGVVTVLGGLISHGAVVAREYGLPCVVGVQKAMSAFKSGDVIILDGTNGTISKIESSETE